MNPSRRLIHPRRANLLDDLAALLAKDQRTAIFVTHNLNEAAKLSQRIAIVIKGKLMQVLGPRNQIETDPSGCGCLLEGMDGLDQREPLSFRN